MGTSWSDTPAADPSTSWADKPSSDPATSWTEDPSSSPTLQSAWDFEPTRDDSNRLARDWQTERLVFINTDDWTDWQTEQMLEGGSSGVSAPAITADTQAVCVDLNGTDELFRDATQVAPTAGANWTISMWIKPLTGILNYKYFLSFTKASNVADEYIGIMRLHSCANATCAYLAVHNGTGVLQKNLRWNGIFAAGSGVDNWNHLTVTYNGAAGSDDDPTKAGRARAYINGAFFALTDNWTNFDYTSIGWAANTVMNMGGGGPVWGLAKFRFYNCAMWDVEITAAEAAVLYNGGVPMDYSVDAPSLGYERSGSLIHWFRFGHDSGDIGKNYGLDPLATGLDMMAAASNIDGTDIVADAP